MQASGHIRQIKDKDVDEDTEQEQNANPPKDSSGPKATLKKMRSSKKDTDEQIGLMAENLRQFQVMLGIQEWHYMHSINMQFQVRQLDYIDLSIYGEWWHTYLASSFT